jgi:hypothetical protein
VVDQRVESWFKPFGGVAPTGHLHVDEAGGDRDERDSPDDDDDEFL